MFHRYSKPLLLVFSALIFIGAGNAPLKAQKKEAPKVTYDDHVKPILRQKCFTCHNPDKKSGDLDLTNYTNLMQGGASGEVIEPGDSSSSYLYSLITHESEPFMPPEQPKLADAMIETIRKWIDGGVLENAGSKANLKAKPKFDFALKTAPTGRPAKPPMPRRMSLETIVRTERSTAVTAMAASPWSPLAAVAGQKQVLLYNTNSRQLLGVLPFPEGEIHVLRFSQNGSLLLAGGGRGGASGKAIVWSVETGERVFEIGDELDVVLSADISADHTLIALGGPQRVVRIYSTEENRLIHELRKHTDWIYSVGFSPDGVLLATGDRNGGLFVWEGWTGREYLNLKGHGAGVTGVSWRSDSNVLASCSEDSTIRLWEMENGGQIKSWGAHGGGVASVDFARDGRILSCGRDRTPKLWNQNGGQIRAFEAFGELALEAAFCDETNRAIAGDWNGLVRIWNAADGNRLGELSTNPLKLQEQLAAANQTFSVRKQENDKLAAAAKTAQDAQMKIQADLAAAQKQSTEATKQIAAADAAMKQSEQTAAQAQKAHEEAAKLVSVLKPAAAALHDAAKNAQQAADKLAGDKELAQIAAKLKTTADAKSKELADNEKTVAAQVALLKQSQAQLAAAQKEKQQATVTLTAAKKHIEQLTPGLKTAQQNLAKAQSAARAAAEALKAAEDSVSRWNDEIAFTSRLAQLRERLEKALVELAARRNELAETANKVEAAQAALAKAKQEAEAAQKTYADLQAQKTNADKKVAEAQTLEKQAETQKTAIAQRKANIEGVLPPLEASANNAQTAATKSDKDKELIAVAATLQELVKARKKTLEEVTKELAQKQKVLQTAQTALAAAQKEAAEITKALEPAKQKVDQLSVAVQMADKELEKAKQLQQGAQKAVAAAEAEADQHKQSIIAATTPTSDQSQVKVAEKKKPNAS